MKHRPFGVDEHDHPIQQIQARVIIGVIRYMQIYLSRQGQAARQTTAQIEARQIEILNQLVARLNEALPDPRTHFTAVDLLKTDRWYSLEFSLFLSEYARILSGDPDFYFNVGGYMIPRALLILTRPLSLRQVYLTLPALMTRLVKTRLQVIGSTATSVHLRWYPDLSDQMPELRPIHIAASCEMWRGAFAAVPRLRQPGAPLSQVSSIVCAKDGLTDYCEWEIRWPQVVRHENMTWVVVMALAIATIGLVAISGRGGLEMILFALLILTNAVGMLYVRSQRQALAANIAQLSEQRDFAQQQYNDITAAQADLHTTNARLERRINELTTLHQIGQMLSETAPVDELIQKSFTALLQTLPYNGFLVIVVDEETQQLSQAWVMRRPGYHLETPTLEFPVKSNSLPAQVLHRTTPLIIEQVTLEAADISLQQFKMKSLIGIPLIHRRRPVGVMLAFLTVGRPIDVADGPLLMTIGAQMAAALDNAALYKNLEYRVQQRTLDLQKATSQAQAAQRERSEFIARMNHELRTPLQAILGFAEVLSSDPALTPAQHDQTHIIVEHAEQLVGMISTATQVARIEAEKGLLQPRRIEIRSFINEVAQSSLGRASNRLQVEYDSVPEALHTDYDKLRMVLQHLIRFMHQRGPGNTLHLRLHYPRRLYFELWNDGDVVSETDLHDIMRLFTRPYNTLTTHNTGMRLSITYQVVMLLGGILSVSLQPNGGLIFRFDIPAVNDADAPMSPSEALLPPPVVAVPADTTLETWPAATLPGIIRDALRRAATRGDLTAMQQTLDVLAAKEPELAAVLDEHMAQFEFDVILKWLE
jgi:signal transduction histidine kinase